MKQYSFLFIALLALNHATTAQTNPQTTPTTPAATQSQTPRPQTPQPSPQPSPVRTRTLDLSDYGVQIAPELRLIVMMAALDAAGFDPTPTGKQPTEFRAQVRRDQANLDPELRARLRRFYELNRLKEPTASPAQQAARYVSLAYALGPAPAFDAPPRSDDLFAGVLDVLDFTPLLREFYNKSGIAERLPAYVAATQKEGDRLRPQTSEMLRGVLSYLHTRPVTMTLERTPLSAPTAKKKKSNSEQPAFLTRERERRFRLVPDLLAVPGSINFRVIGDDYYAVVPAGIDPSSSDVRRAYLQYVVDPIIFKNNREVALKRADIRSLLDAHPAQAIGDNGSGDASAPDIFTTVGRSLVVAADARMSYNARLQTLTDAARARLQSASEPERARIAAETQTERARLEDELTAQLADAYERGAVFAFYFSEQLRGQEIAGFDFANFFADMMNRVDAAREKLRPEEYAAARERVLAARREAAKAAANRTTADTRTDAERVAFGKSIAQINDLLRQKNYTEAETRLRALMSEHEREPRIFFGLAQASSLAASDALDEGVRDERLGRALANYRFAVQSASAETDRALISRAYTAMGRILAFLERRDEAIQAFESAMKLGDVRDGAYADAERGLRELRP